MEKTTSLRESFDEYLNYCQFMRRLTPQTMVSKVWILNDFAKFTEAERVEDLTTRHVNDWIMWQSKRGLNSRTINMRVCHIVAMLRYFNDMGVPVPGVKIRLIVRQKETEPVRRVFYTREQIDRVLEHCNQIQWILIKLSFDCGLRISELRSLRLRNISGRMIVFTGKGNKRREAYMSTEARHRLDNWITSREVTDFLWVRSSGRVLCVQELRYLMKGAFEAAGISDFYPHALRHSFATDIQRNGATVLEAQRMLGHSTSAVTERYLHGLDGQMSACFERLKFGGGMGAA